MGVLRTCDFQHPPLPLHDVDVLEGFQLVALQQESARLQAVLII